MTLPRGGSVRRMSDDGARDQPGEAKADGGGDRKGEYAPPAGAEVSATWTAGGASIDYTAYASDPRLYQRAIKLVGAPKINHDPASIQAAQVKLHDRNTYLGNANAN